MKNDIFENNVAVLCIYLYSVYRREKSVLYFEN